MMTSFCLLKEVSDSMASVRKRGKVYGYRFSVASISGVRNLIQKSRFNIIKERLNNCLSLIFNYLSNVIIKSDTSFKLL